MTLRVDVERLGGFAGFGGPGSHLRSRGSVALDALAADVRGAITALFERGHGAAPAHPDGFRYRLTLGGHSIEVPESVVPPVLRDCVKDELV